MVRTRLIVHVALEPIDGRYSKQWLENMPAELEHYLNGSYKFRSDTNDEWELSTIYGDSIADTVTKGAFLDFAKTNIWKSEQAKRIAHAINIGDIKDGDILLFTDAWNPVILQCRYMIDLLKKNIKMVGIWHAGSYDTNDTLGYTIKDRTWSLATEQAMFHALDLNVFATNFHIDFFKRECLKDQTNKYDYKIVRSGQPHKGIRDAIKTYSNMIPHKERDNIILFPHRDCKEKNADMFRQISHATRNDGWSYQMTAGMNLPKEEYYKLLSRTKIVISLAKHEMFGISMLEAAMMGCYVIAPDNLSYPEVLRDVAELYDHRYLDSPMQVNGIVEILADYKEVSEPNNSSYGYQKPLLRDWQWLHIMEDYLTATAMWDAMIRPEGLVCS